MDTCRRCARLLEDISILVTNPENIKKQIEKCNDLDALKKVSKILQEKINILIHSFDEFIYKTTEGFMAEKDLKNLSHTGIILNRICINPCKIIEI